MLNKGYEVYGFFRRTSAKEEERLAIISNQIHRIEGDLTDQGSLITAIQKSKPDEVYHLGAQSFVAHSFDSPITTGDITGLGAARVLEAIKTSGRDIKFYQASSSEMFGEVLETPQNEKTPFRPMSPYGCAKVYAHNMAVLYRKFGIFAASGILFNHESSRRGLEFVSRKITHNVAKIQKGLAEKLSLGNLSAERDWGFAGDYVKAMWAMLQYEKPETFVVATNKTYPVRTFVEMAFNEVDKNIEWVGKGLDEKGIDKKTGNVVVDVNSEFFRPAEVQHLRGDYSKAKSLLGWEPKVGLEKLVEMMVRHDLYILENHKSVYYPEKTNF